MPVDNCKVIDFIKEDGDNIILAISDHLEWDERNEHVLVLQEKINSYIMAVESGQLKDKYPDSTYKHITITLGLKYSPNSNGALFLSKAKEFLLSHGYGFNYFVVK